MAYIISRDFAHSLPTGSSESRENCAFPISASAGWSVKKLETSDTVESCVEISDRSLYHDKESHHIRLENGNNPDTGI